MGAVRLPPHPMAWTRADIPSLQGRTALVTGANSGLGLETARALAAQGATVLLACRSLANAEQTATHLAAEGLSGLEPLELNLADLESVRSAASAVATAHTSLDLLINNAGVMAPPLERSAQGFELQLAVNHLGHFALTQALLPLLERRPGARVVHVSSGAAYFGRIAFDDLGAERRYDPWGAYGQSKLANVMTALELQRRLSAAGSTVGQGRSSKQSCRRSSRPSAASAGLVEVGGRAPTRRDRPLSRARVAGGKRSRASSARRT